MKKLYFYINYRITENGAGTYLVMLDCWTAMLHYMLCTVGGSMDFLKSRFLKTQTQKPDLVIYGHILLSNHFKTTRDASVCLVMVLLRYVDLYGFWLVLDRLDTNDIVPHHKMPDTPALLYGAQFISIVNPLILFYFYLFFSFCMTLEWSLTL